MSLILSIDPDDHQSFRQLLMKAGGFRKLYIRAAIRACIPCILYFSIYQLVHPSEMLVYVMLVLIPYLVLLSLTRIHLSRQLLLDSLIRVPTVAFYDDGVAWRDEKSGYLSFTHASQLAGCTLAEDGLVFYGHNGSILSLIPFSKVSREEKFQFLQELEAQLEITLNQGDSESCDFTEQAKEHGELIYRESPESAKELEQLIELTRNRQYSPYFVLISILFILLGVVMASNHSTAGSVQFVSIIFILATLALGRSYWWKSKVPKKKACFQGEETVCLTRYANIEDGFLNLADSRGCYKAIPLSSIDECLCMKHLYLLRSKGKPVCICNPDAPFEFIAALKQSPMRLKPSFGFFLKQMAQFIALAALLITFFWWLIEILAVLQ
ncbi:MAG: hypothetical protein R3Y56_03690 [Akkermansia sp.]